MKAAIAMLLMIAPLAARAQTLDLPGSPPPALAPPPAEPGQSCMSVTAGAAVSFGCINAQQRALAEQHRQTLGATTPGATAPSPSLGVFNQAATREHLGNAFGHSTVPQRPPASHYGNPLLPH